LIESVGQLDCFDKNALSIDSELLLFYGFLLFMATSTEIMLLVEDHSPEIPIRLTGDYHAFCRYRALSSFKTGVSINSCEDLARLYVCIKKGIFTGFYSLWFWKKSFDNVANIIIIKHRLYCDISAVW
jgi:hypothetical protein